MIQRRGDFVQVLPKPLALRLAGERWAGVHADTANEWFAGTMPERLRTALCDQLRLLDFLPTAQALVAQLCGPSGPFSNPEVLNTETGSRCFRSLVEANPRATLEALVRAFGSWTIDQLLAVKAGRRDLVWSLEKLCFRRETFADAARLLAAFAAAENELWGNNATGQFVSLFQLLLSGTQATGEEKLAIADEVLKSDDIRLAKIGVEALGHGLTTHSFSRVSGPEKQGSGLPLEDWRPNQAEALSFLDAVLVRLTAIAANSDELGVLAKSKIAENLRGLISVGLVDGVRRAVSEVIKVTGAYWPSALDQIASTMHFNGDKLPTATFESVNEIYESLLPKSLEDRLRFYVTDLPWGFLRRGDAEGKDLAAVEELAEECAKVPAFVLDHLPELLRGSQRNAGPFGLRLGQTFADPQKFILKAIQILRTSSNADSNATLLGAFLAGAQEKNWKLVEQTLDDVAADARLQGYLVELTRLVRVSRRDIDRLISVLKAGGVTLSSMVGLAYGRVLSTVTPDDVGVLLDALASFGADGARVALEIALYFGYEDQIRSAAVRSYVHRILFTPNLLVDGRGKSQFAMHAVEALAKKELRDNDPEGMLAQHLAKEIVKVCGQRQFPYSAEGVIVSLVETMLHQNIRMSWPIFEAAIAGKSGLVTFNLQHVLGKRHDDPGPIYELDNSFLLSWCRREPASAPLFVARTMPLLTSDGDGLLTWSTVATMLFDEFGDRREVLSEVSANMGTFGWTGSLVSYYERYISPLEGLLSHPHKEVRGFAQRELASIRETIRIETKRDEERDFGIY